MVDSALAEITPSELVSRWKVGAILPKTVVSCGRTINLNYRTNLEESSFQAHKFIDKDGIRYNIAREGNYNVILDVVENNKTAPLASASMVEESGAATVKVLQRVTACVSDEEVQIPDTDQKIHFFKMIQHPYIALQQGPQKINWQECLLDACEVIARNSGYKVIQVLSAFANQHLRTDIMLSLGIQQYDSILIRLNGYIPFDSSDKEIAGRDRDILKTIIRKLRDKTLRTPEDVNKFYPEARIPKNWRKQL